MQTFWIHRTNKGKVLYRRPSHKFSPADILRIQRRVLEKWPPGAEIDKNDRFAEILTTVLRELSEYMVDVILDPAGLGFLSDNVVAWIQSQVDAVYNAVGDYLKNARGPVGIPGKGVF